LVASAHTAALLLLAGIGFGQPLLFARITAVDLVEMVLKVYLFAFLLYWVTTFVAQGAYAPGVRLLAQLCEPVLKRVRRVIPPIGQIDFSFLWVSIAIGALLILLR
jgi:YggT family protein